MVIRRLVILAVIFLILLATGVVRVEGHHTGVACGPVSDPGRAVCLPYADSSFAVKTLQQTKQLSYCFNQRARNYPGFVSQVRETLNQHEQALGIRHVEVPGIYQTDAQARAAGCQVWNAMPETHGCSGCGAWVHYLNSPVIIEYRWQAGYSDWKTTITHEYGHIYGLHEHYDDANFRSYRGTYGRWAHGINQSPGTATDARTVMDFGMSGLYGNLAWQFSEYDVKYSCQNMDPRGQYFAGCGFVEQSCAGPTDASWGGVWNPCTELWEGPGEWDYSPAAVSPFGEPGVWQTKAGASEWGPRATYSSGFAVWNYRLSQWHGEFTTVMRCTYVPPDGPWEC